MPIVLDTNVLVSGALWPESKPGIVFDHVQFTDRLLFSEATFAEFQAVLMRPKFDRYLDATRRDRFLGRLRMGSTFVEIRRQLRICRDPDDDKLLDVAINGAAEFIISGDADLLALHPFEGVSIVTAASYLAHVSR